MKIWNEISQRTNSFIWISAIAISLVLLSIVLSQVDWVLAISMTERASSDYLIISILLFLAEGIFTSLRFYFLTPNNPKLSECFKVTAWYVVYLILLPIRLGEVVVIILLKKYLNQNTSPALMNILVQRLIDVIILSTVFLITAIILTPLSESEYLNFIAAAIIIIVLSILIWFNVLLSAIAKIISRNNVRPENKWVRHLYRMFLQARIWHRHRLSPLLFFQTIILTILKWTCNLGGFVFLIQAIYLPITTSNSIVLGALYNFLAVIPIQTIGGFGVSEAGLTGLLIISGISLTLAASAAIIVRLVIIIIPLLFWCITMGIVKLLPYREVTS